MVHHALLDALMLSYRNLIRILHVTVTTFQLSARKISVFRKHAAFEVLPGKSDLIESSNLSRICMNRI